MRYVLLGVLVVWTALTSSCLPKPRWKLPPLCGPTQPEFWDNRCRKLADYEK